MVELSTEKISNNILWPIICEVEYIAASDTTKEVVWLKKFISELGVVLSIDGQFYSTMTALEPSLQRRNQRPISVWSIFYVTTTLSERSWIEVTSRFWRSMERKIRLTHLLKPSVSKNLKIINRRWVFDTIPIDFSLS